MKRYVYILATLVVVLFVALMVTLSKYNGAVNDLNRLRAQHTMSCKMLTSREYDNSVLRNKLYKTAIQDISDFQQQYKDSWYC